MDEHIDFFHYKSGLVNKDSFSSEDGDLNKYVKRVLGQHELRSISRNYVGIYQGEFVSFFCLSASTLNTKERTKTSGDLPKNQELPTVKIGRLAVDKKYKGKGYGEITLSKAISIFIELSKKLGAVGLTVDAKKAAVGFYSKYGFEVIYDGKNTTSMILYTSLLHKKQPSLFEDPV